MRFLRVELARIINCVPGSVAAQHMETYNNLILLVFIIQLSEADLVVNGDFMSGW